MVNWRRVVGLVGLWGVTLLVGAGCGDGSGGSSAGGQDTTSGSTAGETGAGGTTGATTGGVTSTSGGMTGGTTGGMTGTTGATSTTGATTGNPDLCAAVDCEEGFECDPQTGDCVEIDLCEGVECEEEDEACDAEIGVCVRLPCDADGACRAGEVCEGEACVPLACTPDPENDTRATATPLGEASQTLDDLSLCAGEQDWFAVTVPAFHTLSARLRFVHGVGDLNMALFVPWLDMPGIVAESDTDDEELITPPIPQATEMSLQVFGVEGAINRYALDLEIACTDPAEPNDTREEATGIGPEGAAFEQLVLCDGDDDWFRLEPPADGQGYAIRVRFDANAGNLDVEAYLDETDEPSFVLDSVTNNDELIVFGGLNSPAWVRVYGAAGVVNLYDFEVVTAPSDTLCIINNQCGDMICDRGVCGPCQADEQCELNNACSTTRRCVPTPCRGVVCEAAELCDVNTSQCAACEADINEPNNNSTEETQVEVGAVLEALSICAEDEDWFSISQPANAPLYIRLGFEHNVGDIDAFILSQQNSLVGDGRSVTDNEEFFVGASPEARTLRLRVLGFNGARNTYTLSTTVCGPGWEGCPAFVCGDGSIIPGAELCDRRAQCGDGSDELPVNTDCPFVCGDGVELPGAQFCDGEPQCAGSEDESCYVCGDGQVLTWVEECNGFEECVDGSDEAGCPTFTCADGTEIAELFACDTSTHCLDGSDEHPVNTDCPYICDNGEELPGESLPYCDGEVQCADGSDEDCFICDDGQILPVASWECDGFLDCQDGSDERSCPTRICATAPENGQWTVDCPLGATIQAVAFASYGTPEGSCEVGPNLGACHAANSVSVVEGRCLGQPSCTIPITNEVFTDPCAGILKAFIAEVTCSP